MPERRSLYWIPDLSTTKNTSTQDKHGFPSLEEDVISWILGKLQEFVCINVSRLEVGCCLLVFTGMSHKKHLMYMLDEWMSVLLMREGKADCTRQLVGRCTILWRTEGLSHNASGTLSGKRPGLLCEKVESVLSPGFHNRTLIISPILGRGDPTC
jgi:hypothetical protein